MNFELPPSVKNVRRVERVQSRGEREKSRRKKKPTVRQIFFASCFVLAHIIDAAAGRVILGHPVPTLEKVAAAPLARRDRRFFATQARCVKARESATRSA
jgi:hypothetical protein